MSVFIDTSHFMINNKLLLVYVLNLTQHLEVCGKEQS